MVELHGWILIAWTLCTVMMAAGSAWGAMKYQQKAFARDLGDLKTYVKDVDDRLTKDESSYLQKADCMNIRNDCKTLRDYQDTTTCKKIAELKHIIADMNTKREVSTKERNDILTDLSNQLATLSERVSTLSKIYERP